MTQALDADEISFFDEQERKKASRDAARREVAMQDKVKFMEALEAGSKRPVEVDLSILAPVKAAKPDRQSDILRRFVSKPDGGRIAEPEVPEAKPKAAEKAPAVPAALDALGGYSSDED